MISIVHLKGKITQDAQLTTKVISRVRVDKKLSRKLNKMLTFNMHSRHDNSEESCSLPRHENIRRSASEYPLGFK